MKMRPRFRALLLLPALAIGAGIAAWLISGAEEPPRHAQATSARAVRVIEVQQFFVRPSARGFGIVRPSETWQAIAKVRGSIVYRHPQLASGNIIPAGTRVLEIDPTEYKLAIAEAEADLTATQAELRQLDAEIENTEKLAAIERDRLGFAEREVERIRSLARSGTSSPARLDEQERATLQQRRAVQELDNQLRLAPSRRIRLEAEAARIQARLDRAERDLADTVITTPLDLRIGEVKVERHQFVSTGQILFSADGIAAAEIRAQIPLEAMHRVVGSVREMAAERNINVLSHVDFSKIDATARLTVGVDVIWEARLARVEAGLDPRTRTVQAVLVVDEPYQKLQSPEQIALLKEMYVEVELVGQPGRPHVAVPDSAVRDGMVPIAGSGNRLQLRPVEVAFRQSGAAIIGSGLEPGDIVVVDDLVPAIEGMALAPRRDLESAGRLAASLAGAQP